MALALQSGKLVATVVDGLTKISCECCDPLIAEGGSIGDHPQDECIMGDPLQTFHRNPPYLLGANQSYLLRMRVSSEDSLNHQGAFYQATFSASPSIPINWTTTYSGAVGNPWTILGSNLRFDFEDSIDCGGTNENVQIGVADALLQTTSDTSLMLSFIGRVERVSYGYDIVQFFLYPQ